MFYEWRWHPGPGFLQELEDDLCHVFVGAGPSMVGRPEECGRRFRNTQEWRDVGHQQVTGRSFRVGRQPSLPARISRDVSGLA